MDKTREIRILSFVVLGLFVILALIDVHVSLALFIVVFLPLGAALLLYWIGSRIFRK